MLKMSLKDFTFDTTWSLFLDRDGIINKRVVDGYVKEIEEFEFVDKAREAIRIFSNIFGKIIIVTNQQGIGKGLMTGEHLQTVHQHMVSEIEKNGGRIDGIYFSPHLESENSKFRKPRTGMALQAKKDFPEIDYTRSIMVGDSLKDMEFGRSLNMITVFISDGEIAEGNSHLIDFTFGSLYEFSLNLPGRSNISKQ